MTDISQQMSDIAKEFADCRTVFTAMGDENRQLIILALLENYGGMRVGEITKKTNLSRPAVSHHLKVLKEAGIVDMFEIGTMNFYHMSGEEQHWNRFSLLLHHLESIMSDIKAVETCENMKGKGSLEWKSEKR